MFFNSPTDIADNKTPAGKRVRLGGMVKMGSLERGDNLQVRFEVTDGNKDIPVSYRGIVPDLFREGQGVIAEGHVEPGGTFTADTVLAKHDENYMPREIVDTLKKQGHWQETARARQGKAQSEPGVIAMIAELGHYALVLALALALIQSWSPVVGARKGDVALMKLADSTALAQFAFCCAGLWRADLLLRDVGFLGRSMFSRTRTRRCR